MKKALAIMAAALTLAGCRENPFLTEWDTPYGIPPFESIKTKDYMPAIKEGILRRQAEIDAIVNSPETPSFENTVAALDRSGELLEKVSGVLFNLSETDGTPELVKVVEEAIPLLSEQSSAIFMNRKLFERVQKVYADASFAEEHGSPILTR